MKLSLRRILRSKFVLGCAGALAAGYLRLVWWTNRFSYHPPGFYESVTPQMPIIVALWHGQIFMTPFARGHYRAKVLVSRHGDGEVVAGASRRLGIGIVRGSGDHGNDFRRKGGVSAFKEMLRTLADAYNMVLTADVPKKAGVAGLGIIMLARESGRPIAPFASATSRFWRFANWDRTTLNLPFGRGAMVLGDLIYVPREADDATMETFRLKLEAAINDATARAYAAIGLPDANPMKAAQHV